jgi:RNA polymerase sigma-70 factor (ECF subfamily)
MNVAHLHVKGLIAGSYKDFTALYRLYAPQLYAYVYSLTRSSAMAEDILQDTFIKVWEGRAQIDETLSFKSYLFTIARNHLLNEFRRQLNHPVFPHYMNYAMEEESHESTIEQKIDFDEFNRILQKAKKKLPSRQIQIFELNKEQGISIKEIARQFNITEQTARNQLSDAIRFLRKEMGRYAFLFSVLYSML